MERVMTDKEKLKQLADYYKATGNKLQIIGLNDSQGVNTTSTFIKKGLLEYLAKALADEKVDTMVINAFSLLMNKTEHIDYFLKNNLSLEEIKLSQIYCVVSSLEKVMSDLNLPRFIGKIGNAYRLIYTPSHNDSAVFITDTLRDSKEPTLIYSSGVNNLMRSVGNNPFAISRDYKDRDIRPNYNYTLSRVKDPQTLINVVDGIERNFDTILGINSQTDIYTLGAYIPKSLEQEGMNLFKELTLAYNEKLKKLCQEYNITFINTEMIGKAYNNSESNFHISSAGHNNLANHILWAMYQRKIVDKEVATKKYMPEPTLPYEGVEGVITSIQKDCDDCLNALPNMDGHGLKRQTDILHEHIRERKVLQKVMANSSRNR